MKILGVQSLTIPAVKVIRFARFTDHRGFFTEPFRNSQFKEELLFMKDLSFVQVNESFSQRGVVRGLHFQWNPFMGKLVRTVHGKMVDLVLDIRKKSPTFGKALAYELISDTDMEYGEWIWVPPGFAHGNFFLEDTTIEYLCTGEYSPGCEAGISPLSDDIDWSICDIKLKADFDAAVRNRDLMSEKDIKGLSVAAWISDDRSEIFQYEKMR